LQDCFKTVGVGVVCVTGPGPRSGQRTDRALHAGGALAVESKLGGCVGPRGRARRRDFHRHVRCAASVLGASVEPRVSSWFMGRRGSLLQSRIGRSKARYGLVAHCQLFVIGDPAGFHHRVKAFFQPLDSTIEQGPLLLYGRNPAQSEPCSRCPAGAPRGSFPALIQNRWFKQNTDDDHPVQQGARHETTRKPFVHAHPPCSVRSKPSPNPTCLQYLANVAR
jgi:hypothetical protein